MTVTLAVICFGLGLAVGGAIVLFKDKDTASRADLVMHQASVEDSFLNLRASVEVWAQNMIEFKNVCHDGFSKAGDAHSDMRNTIGALDLEVQRLREKQKKMEAAISH